jgi:DNA polymerase elongation subunit (family B)
MPYGAVHYNKKTSVIDWSEYDENNVRTSHSKKWVPDYFVETNKEDAEFVSEDGVPLKRKEFNTWSQRRKAKSEDKEIGLRIYGSDLSPENKFILETWPEDIVVRPKVNAMILDIETECEKGFPDPDKVEERINLITCWSNTDNRFTTFSFQNWDRTKSELKPELLDRVDFVLCKDEEEMLLEFITYVERKKHDIWSGWNSSGFDIPYIFNRVMKILDGIDIADYNRLLDLIKIVKPADRKQYYDEIKQYDERMDYTNRLSLYGQVSKVQKMVKDNFTKEMKKQMSYTIYGMTDKDYLRLDQKFRMGKRDSYKLDDVAFDELGERKLDYEGTIKEFYQKDWNRFVDYNIVDVDLVVRMDESLGYIAQSVSLSYMCHCQFKDNFGTVIKAETAIYNYLMKDSVVANDPSEEKEEYDDKIPGAYVTKKEELRRGKSRWIIDVDIASLYPSLMRGINISYDTKVGKILTKKNIFEMDENEEVMVENGTTKKIKVGKLKQYIQAQGYQVSTNNIIFKNLEKDKGVLVKMLDKSYAQRKVDKKKSAQHRDNAIKIFENSEGNGTHEVEDDGKTKMLTEDEFNSYHEESRLEGIHHNLQWSCKILLNSIYGCLACSFFRGFDRDVASAVTLSGQTVIKNNGTMMNEYFENEVCNLPIVRKNFKVDDSIKNVDVRLYTDTDSIYLTFDRMMDKLGVGKSDEERLKVTRFLAKIATNKLEKFAEDFFPQRFNAKNSIFWDQELIARTGIWCAPKKYVCHILEENNKAPKNDMLKKGLDIVRSSIPRKFKKHLTTCVDNMLKDHDESELQQYIKDLYKEFRGWTIAEIAIPSSCNNWIKWGACKGLGFLPSTPQHMKGAVAYNYYRELLGITHYEPIKERDRFSMVFIKKNSEYPIATFGYKDKLPAEMDLERLIDWDAHFERGFVKPLKQIFEAMEWKFPETSVEFQNVDDLFE